MGKYFFITYVTKKLGKEFFNSEIIDEHPFIWIKRSQLESNSKMVLAGWQEISEKEYKMYFEDGTTEDPNRITQPSANAIDLLNGDSSEGGGELEQMPVAQKGDMHNQSHIRQSRDDLMWISSELLKELLLLACICIFFPKIFLPYQISHRTLLKRYALQIYVSCGVTLSLRWRALSTGILRQSSNVARL